MASKGTPIDKQAVGIDVSKDTFDVKFMVRHAQPDGHTRIRGSRKFANSTIGFKNFLSWILKKKTKDVQLVFALEATGVYHEQLSFFLHDKHYDIAVLLPNTVKAFARSLNQHAKTDAIDAGVIARLAIERDLERWQPVGQAQRALRALTRERQSMLKQKTRLTNQLHAHKHGYDNHKTIVKRLKARIRALDKQLQSVIDEIEVLSKVDTEVGDMIERLCTIPQVGLVTAATVVAETGGFALFKSRQQVVKYAGMDIVERQSGTSVNGRGRLSKRGSGRLRTALYLSSVGMVNRSGVFRNLYERVLRRNACKKQALVAIQRKLLVVMYAIAKSGEVYDAAKHALAVKGVDEPDDSPTVTLSAKASRS